MIMKLADEVKVALVTAACLLGIAIIFKNVLHVQADFIISNSPSLYYYKGPSQEIKMRQAFVLEFSDNFCYIAYHNVIRNMTRGGRATLRHCVHCLAPLGHVTADKREIKDFPKLPLATSFIRETLSESHPKLPLATSFIRETLSESQRKEGV
jgi:hypothetical protein